MVTDNTPAKIPAIDPRYQQIPMVGGRVERPDVVVRLSVADKPLGRLSVFLGDDVLVSRHRDPCHAACRALLALGITGTVAFIHQSTGTPGLVMDVERGAKLATADNDSGGMQTVKYVPFDRTRVGKGRLPALPGSEAGPGSDAAQNDDGLKPPHGLVDANGEPA